MFLDGPTVAVCGERLVFRFYLFPLFSSSKMRFSDLPWV